MKSLFRLTLCTMALTASVGCRKQPAPNEQAATDIRTAMQDAYANTRELFSYVWGERSFYEPKSEANIIRLLSALSTDFHDVEKNTPVEMFEPGFRTTLAVHQGLLADAKTRFQAGQKEYANWALRGVAASCISCHSRMNTPVDFAGAAPAVTAVDDETRLARAEFLFATRQFNDASAQLWDIVTSEASPALRERALKLWLVIQIRNKGIGKDAVPALRKLLDVRAPHPVDRKTITRWISDIRELQNKKLVSSLANAQALLSGTNEISLQEQDSRLVKTLAASAMAHEQLLRGNELSLSERRRATLLLGIAYLKMPIITFEPFQQLYLELTIRDFPHTVESEIAYNLYKRLEIDSSTGSAGTHLDPEQQAKLEELRKLALPATPETLRDTADPNRL